MSTPRTRATFLDVAQIVERSRCYAGRAHALLMQARRAKDLDDRSRSFLDLVEAQRVELERAIEQRVVEAGATVEQRERVAHVVVVVAQRRDDLLGSPVIDEGRESTRRRRPAGRGGREGLARPRRRRGRS